MKPKVSIGVCVKNGASTIREAIESIIHQDFPHELMEVIFVDDGSEDETPSIIRYYASKMDMKTKVFHHKWKGLGPSRNVVVNNAHGDYIIWVDADMILPKNHVRKQVEFMERNSKVGIGKAKYGFMRRESMVAVLENIPWIVFDSRAGSMEVKLPGTGGAVYRVDAIRQVGGFDNCMKGVGEDQDAAYRVREVGWAIKRSPAFFYERRVRVWGDLWRKHFWYGYGDYFLYRKNRNVFSLYRMIPVAGFVVGALTVVDAYRLTHLKSVFMLPFHYAFKLTSWCFGFVRAQVSS